MLINANPVHNSNSKHYFQLGTDPLPIQIIQVDWIFNLYFKNFIILKLKHFINICTKEKQWSSHYMYYQLTQSSVKGSRRRRFSIASSHWSGLDPESVVLSRGQSFNSVTKVRDIPGYWSPISFRWFLHLQHVHQRFVGSREWWDIDLLPGHPYCVWFHVNNGGATDWNSREVYMLKKRSS